MRNFKLSMTASLALGLGGVALGQYQQGPVYPQRPQPYGSAPSGYDPFRLDSSTGRFVYVPIPYDTTGGYSPYQFNWYSGRWDYVPVQPPASVTAQQTSNAPSFQMSPQQYYQPMYAPQSQQSYWPQPGDYYYRPIQQPATQPTTQPTPATAPSAAPARH
jgi:hypothetical protein